MINPKSLSDNSSTKIDTTHSGSPELKNQRNRLESDLVLNLVAPQNIRTHHEYVNAQVRLTLPPRIHYPLGFRINPKSLIDLNSISLNTTPSGSPQLENQRNRLQSGLVFDLFTHQNIDREDALSMVPAGATADTTQGNNRASRESG